MNLRDESGQAITEYIVLLSIVIAAFMMLAAAINNFGLASKLTAPVQQSFTRAYQYGSPTAYGFEANGPKNHPRITSSGNFRIFINPELGGGQDAE